MDKQLITIIADCLEENSGLDFGAVAEELIRYLSERGYEIEKHF